MVLGGGVLGGLMVQSPNLFSFKKILFSHPLLAKGEGGIGGPMVLRGIGGSNGLIP